MPEWKAAGIACQGYSSLQIGFNYLHFYISLFHQLLDVSSEPTINKVNTTQEHGSSTSPLHFAALHGHNFALQTLLTSYINPNVKDDNGCTPLDLASYAGHIDCVNTLLTHENQADVLVYSHKSRRTALHAAGIMPSKIHP